MSLVRNFNIDDYHRGSAVSKSQLDALDKSPYHFWSLHRDPNRPARKTTEAMVLGTMTHTALLEPKEFSRRHVIAPECDRRTKVGKAIWAEFLESLMPGQEPAEPAMISQALAMAESVRRVPILRDLLAQGEAEISAYWTDPDSGVECRCRPDWAAPDGDAVWLVDLKSCLDASPEGFAKSIVNYSYAKQSEFYKDGFQAASGKRVKGFIFAAVEKAWPHAAEAYELTPEDQAFGRNQYRANLYSYAEAMRTGIWHSYSDGKKVRPIAMPAWATNNHEDIEIGYAD